MSRKPCPVGVCGDSARDFVKKTFCGSCRIFNARCCTNNFRLPQDIVIPFDKHKILHYDVNGWRKILWCCVLVKNDRARRDMIGLERA